MDGGDILYEQLNRFYTGMYNNSLSHPVREMIKKFSAPCTSGYKRMEI